MDIYVGKKRVSSSIKADKGWLADMFTKKQIKQLREHKLVTLKNDYKYGTDKAWGRYEQSQRKITKADLDKRVRIKFDGTLGTLRAVSANGKIAFIETAGGWTTKTDVMNVELYTRY